MPESPPLRSRSPATNPALARESALNPETAPCLRVRYYHRMRMNRVFTVQVGWAKAGGRGLASGPVTVRLLMAGAQVVPLEQPLDPSDSQAKATFHVTPIAKGWLRGERIEVVQAGRKIQEIKLPSRVTSQRVTWVLLLLTFLIPFWVVPFFTKTGALQEETKPAMTPLPLPTEPPEPGQPILGEVGKKAEKGGKGGKGGKGAKGGAKDEPGAKGEKGAKGGKGGKGGGKGIDKAGGPKKKDGPNEEYFDLSESGKIRPDDPPVGTPGSVLTKRLHDWAPPALPAVEEEVPDAAEALYDLPGFLGNAYTYAYNTVDVKDIKLSYYTFWGLLLLTILSCWWHGVARKTRKGAPLTGLARAGEI